MKLALYLILTFMTASMYTVYKKQLEGVEERLIDNNTSWGQETDEIVRHYRTVTYLMLVAMVVSIIAFILCLLKLAINFRM